MNKSFFLVPLLLMSTPLAAAEKMVVKSASGLCQVRYDPDIWQNQPYADESVLSFVPVAGKESAFLTCSPSAGSTKAMRASFISYMREKDNDAIFKEAYRKINKRKILSIKAVIMTLEGPRTYWMSLYGSKEMTVKFLISHTGLNERARQIMNEIGDKAFPGSMRVTWEDEANDEKVFEPKALALLNGLE